MFTISFFHFFALGMCLFLCQYAIIVSAALVSPTALPKYRSSRKSAVHKQNLGGNAKRSHPSPSLSPSISAEARNTEKTQLKISSSTTVLPNAPRSGHRKLTKTTTTTTTTVTKTFSIDDNESTGVTNFTSTDVIYIQPADPAFRRIYSTNALPEFKRNGPSLFPPGLIHSSARKANLTFLDIGANNGDAYTLRAAKAGHTVLAFEPSSSLREPFKEIMRNNGVPLSLVHVPLISGIAYAKHGPNSTSLEKLVQRDNVEKVGSTENSDVIRVIIPRDDGAPHPRVYLVPFGLSNRNGEVPFYEAKCGGKHPLKCGKTNRMMGVGNRGSNSIIQAYRLDDIVLPVDESSVMFVKIDVEGHELEVIRGAREFLRKGHVQYIAVEFSPNGRKGTKWGTDLLEELFNLGYSCYHLRGFGKCINEQRPATLKCNYPFPLSDFANAPTFQQYAKIFEITERSKMERPRMADLMCKRRNGSE